MSSSFSDVNLPFYLCLLDIRLKDGGNQLNPVRDTNLKTLLCAKITLSTHKLHFEHCFQSSVIPLSEFPSCSQNQRQMQTTSLQLQTVYGRENAICFHSTGKKNKIKKGGGARSPDWFSSALLIKHSNQEGQAFIKPIQQSGFPWYQGCCQVQAEWGRERKDKRGV